MPFLVSQHFHTATVFALKLNGNVLSRLYEKVWSNNGEIKLSEDSKERNERKCEINFSSLLSHMHSVGSFSMDQSTSKAQNINLLSKHISPALQVFSTFC